jgi:60 kDa SS-A/Ro ribonucleoprotein
MSRISKRFPTTTNAVPTTKNVEGYPAFEKQPKTAYLQMLMTNVLGNTYYSTKEDQTVEALAMHTQAIKNYPDFVGPAAVYARNKGYMRSQPTMAMAYLARAGHPDFEKLFGKVILTPNDLVDFMTFYANIGKGQGGRRLKRVVGNWLVANLNAYWIIKYGSEGKSGYSLKDLLITVHPKGLRADYATYIMKGELDVLNKEIDQELVKLLAFEALKTADTWEVVEAAVKTGRLPHEVVTNLAGKYPQVWDTLVPNMPIFALLRNLVTLDKHGVLANHKKLIQSTLTSPEAIAKSKILPFQFIKAFDACKALPTWTQDALRDAVDLSVTNIPSIMQNTMLALDISGSMDGEPVMNGAILGLALARKADNNKFYQFDTSIEEVKVSKRDSLLTQASSIHARGGTNTELVGAQLGRNTEKVDILVLLTDEQQNTGGSFYKHIEKYRRSKNSKLKLFIVDVGSYASSGGLAPEGGLNYYIVGMSPRILDFISLAAEGFDSMVDAIEKGAL